MPVMLATVLSTPTPAPGPESRHENGHGHGHGHTAAHLRSGAASHAPRDPRRSRRLLVALPIALALIGALFAARALTPDTAGDSLDDSARDFLTLSLSVIIESLPFVFLGIFLSIAVQLWVPDRVMMRLLPAWAPGRRIVLSLLGVLLPVCECGNVPLARGLMIKGLTVAESTTFLLAAPILNPVTIITTYQAFGWDDGILVARILGGFVIANLVGWLFSRHPSPETLLTGRFQEACARGSHAAHGGKAVRALQLFRTETAAMLPALFLGSAIAGLIQVAVSRDLLVTLGANPVWSVLALMLLAFVVSICSNVDAFFILSFGSLFMPGAIVAFLVFGAMIDVKMLALMRTTFSPRALVQITTVVALSSAVLGLAVNNVA